MVDIQHEVAVIEFRIKSAGFTIRELLRRADVDVAQWQRWKNGKQTPLVTTWDRIHTAANELDLIVPKRRNKLPA